VANAIPDGGIAEGTVRCLDDEAWHTAPDLLKELIDSVAAAYGVNAELSYQRYVPPTVNDQASTAMISAAALGVLGAGSVVQTPQSLGGEDFAWFLESIPGALARLGTRVPGSVVSHDIHQPTFDVDERAIGVGVRVMAATAITALWDDGAIVAQPLPGVTGALRWTGDRPGGAGPRPHLRGRGGHLAAGDRYRLRHGAAAPDHRR
jgi:amidohydrolase